MPDINKRPSSEKALEQTFQEIYTNVHLNEGISCLRQFFIDIYLSSGASVKQLANGLRLPVPVVSAIKNECKKQGFVSVSGGLKLSEIGLKYVRENMRYETVDLEKLTQVLAIGCSSGAPADFFAAETDRLDHIYRERPPVDVTIDQSLCTAETGIKRALLMLKNSGLIGRRVLFAGDDDLTSIAVMLILKSLEGSKKSTLAPADITVMDTDERVLRYIEETAAGLGFPVQCVSHDLRRPFPKASTEASPYAHAFDIVFTDPPYTLNGLSLFVSRGIQALKQEPDLTFFLSFAHKDPQTRLAVQRLLSETGLVIAQILPSFNQYHGAQILGGVSDLTLLTTTRETCPVIEGLYNEPLYTNEARRSLRVYICKQCHTAYPVGYGEDIKTIEQLKGTGCKNCGGNIFTLRERKLGES